MTSFEALLISKTESGHTLQRLNLTEADLMEGDVTVKVEHSTVNFKDGLAITGKSPIIRKFPLIPGIDFAGSVISSAHSGYKPGDKVVLTGWGVGETHHGGFAGMARVPGDWLVHLPANMTTSQAMAIGTAGFTAMLCVMALEHEGVQPDSGDVIVTGAAGGVGSVAVALLAKLGYRVVASTGRLSEEPYLKSLGAAAVIDRNEFNTPVKPLAKARFAGAIDSVGSVTLANVLSQINPEGTVAACGLAQGMDLPASVAPFVLRGVKLIGVNSVTVPIERRREAWRRLSAGLDLKLLDSMTTHITLGEVPRTAMAIVEGKVRGRTVVDL